MYMMPYDADFFSNLERPFEGLFKQHDLRPGLKNFMTTDVIETKDGLKLIMDLPGLKKEDIKIKFENGYVTISAESSKQSEEKSEEGNYLRRERHSGSYTRSFYVGENLTPGDIKAKFEDGALTLNFPKEKAIDDSNKFISIEG